uniref:NADH-ubiquinone oxidoreductase chain 6 n=1 Tax=Crangon hakodatei TaxID=1884866 RepID=A0A1C9CYF4_9EUCA|nr:NADH dehydrogenase subunit 6 [Crangon hakodatei]
MPTLIHLSLLVALLAFIFTRLKHPLTMGFTLLAQTILICLTAGSSFNSMWFSYILFLIFFGALLVLFIYMASLAPNEVFSLSIWSAAFLIIVSMVTMILLFTDISATLAKMTLESSFFNNNFTQNSTPAMLSLMYSMTTSSLTIFIILYLLLTLVVVVKISSAFLGPLRML